MYISLFLFKKLEGTSVAAAETPIGDGRLFVKDKNSKLSFLIDTGAQISVVPPTNINKNKNKMYEPFFSLFAANGSIIKTYGTQIFELDLGLRRNFIWKFIIADVSKPIIGSDFLKYFDLLPDLKNFSLVDRKTLLKVSAKFSNEPSLELNMIQNSNEYHKLLERYGWCRTYRPI